MCNETKHLGALDDGLYDMRISPADMSKKHALCEESTKFGTVVFFDMVNKSGYGDKSRN